MEISIERQERAVAEFTKQPERYIDLALRSDIKIQLLLAMLTFDYINIDDKWSKLIKKIPREILTDFKKSVNSKNSGQNTTKEEIEQFVIKYSLSEENYKITKTSEYDECKGTSYRYSFFINNYDYVVKWIEGAISDIRQEKLAELGLTQILD
jgi:hypothetical protein